MTTPAHAVLNLLVLGRRAEPWVAAPILIGGALPDVPMFAFYFVEKVVLETPERVIWTSRYYDPGWQAVIDLLHSAPVILLALAFASWAGSRWLTPCLASMALHVPADFFLHNDDAHRHLFPLSDWRFESPVSYWDPRHFGSIVAPLEMMAVATATLALVQRHEARGVRAALGTVGVSYAAYLGYVLWMWA